MKVKAASQAVAAAATLKALAGQFARAGTESLENPQVFEMPDVVRAGDLPALKTLGEPAGRSSRHQREALCRMTACGIMTA